MNRREFLRKAGIYSGAIALSSTIFVTADVRAAGQLKKAVKLGMVAEDVSLAEKFQILKELGFDGVEMNSPNDYETDEVIDARKKAGIPIHGVVDSVHWNKTLGDPDSAVREEGLEGLRTAITDAKDYGATSVLLVPAVVNENIPYDDAYRRSQTEIKKVIPMAEKQNIQILIENVWNKFLLSPLEEAQYLDELDSKWIGAYFDVGNVVNFGYPEQWIRILGHRVKKLDIKEYSREKRDEEGPFAGFRVPIGEGSVDWAAVRRALNDINYSGWATAEVSGGNRERLQDIASRMNQVLQMS
jgi:hexulose-6-phosphate isomerase